RQQQSPFSPRNALSNPYGLLTHMPQMCRAVPGCLPSTRHLNFQWCPEVFMNKILHGGSKQYQVQRTCTFLITGLENPLHRVPMKRVLDGLLGG
ncbi:MAG: hypothetical protein MJA30_29595, partial [Cytophagales bacterium]|nr:hypothetical protein [Cytophagales bacterium]